MIPHVKKIKIAKCPCANDVVIIGIVCDDTLDGVYLGLTMSGFWDDNGTSWYNLTENICSAFKEDFLDCLLVNVVLTNHHLILLTSLGLFVSGDLRYPRKTLMFSRANFCGFEREDYKQAKLWYHERCLANREQFEDEVIAITFNKNKTLSQVSTCFFGIEPFIIWKPCFPKFSKKTKIISQKIVSFLFDPEQKTAIYLIKTQDRISVVVRTLQKRYIPHIKMKFPSFNFPKSFSLALGMVFHPRSHFLYVFGTQIFQMPHLEVFIGRPTLMEINSRGYWDDTDSYTIEITAVNRYLRQGMTSISFVVWQASIFCYMTTIILTLKGSCSCIKTMYLIPNQEISMSAWGNGTYRNKRGFNMIKTLPENYRPPSHLGIAIPLTNNFYNADPSKPKPRNLFPESKVTGKYKKCFNKSTRAECNCSTTEKLSYSIDFSDCREKVPRYKFPVTQYPISLNIRSEDYKELKMEPPFLVTVTEVNQRENWKIKQHMPETMMKLKNYVESKIFLPVYNPKDLNLSITGAELFHFRVVVIPGVTYCNFYDEFQIYVDDVPLPFPGRILIATSTAVVLWGFIFVSFMLEVYNIRVWKPFKNMILRKKKVSFSFRPVRVAMEKVTG